jgi:SAM-dependent methyltransferase
VCHPSCLEFLAKTLSLDEVAGKKVIEVGARDFNGTVRPLIERYGPRKYLGVDIEMGPGVDEVCDACSLLDKYPANSFDLVVSTEMLEHVADWRLVTHNLKQLVKVGGVLIVTTRSVGFGYHGYPNDFWRFQQEDMRALFSDLMIEVLEDDPSPGHPGVFLKARKPINFNEISPANYRLFSIIRGRRVTHVTGPEVLRFRTRYWIGRIVQRGRNLRLRIRRLFGR